MHVEQASQAIPATRADVHGRKVGVAPLALGALGVVYGDIGTSPLYAVRDCFQDSHAVGVNHDNVLGVLSLIFWSLVGVIAVKYLTFLTRADNEGEGGEFALLARISAKGAPGTKAKRSAILLLLVFGASMLYGDGAITPAVSVLSAVEGLAVSPSLQPWIVPITCMILAALFLVQRYGTARVGSVFGPIMLGWFVALAVLGLIAIVRYPSVLLAVDPRNAVEFFMNNQVRGFLTLGAVVLAITGGEALYADMGHFGRRPIIAAWYGVVMPALLLNYYGQGAYLLTHPEGTDSPFYALVPSWAHYPMVGLATMAAVIASQALISGVFSITNQATQLGYWPRINVVHTSVQHTGQIYLPGINTALMVVCLLLVLGFQRSTNMTGAYGLAVTATMLVTSLGFFVVAYRQWHWPLIKVLPLVGFFLVFDLAFLSANVIKIADGGWVPLLMGGAMFTIMTTWRKGRHLLGVHMNQRAIPVERFLREIDVASVHRIPGTAVFLTSNPRDIPPVLRHHFEHNRVLHEQVVLLSILSQNVPFVSPRHRLELEDLGHGFFRLRARFGFMETPKVPAVLEACAILGMAIDPEHMSYYLGRETLLTGTGNEMASWRKRIFAFCSRNGHSATAYFGIPPDRVVEMGMQIEL